MPTFSQSCQGRGIDILSRRPQKRRDGPPDPAAGRGAMHEDKCCHENFSINFDRSQK
jgi:hypothetical protein